MIKTINLANKFASSRKAAGQSFFEYTLGMIAVVLLMFGMIQVFIWVGRDQVQRLQAHDRILQEALPAGGGGAAFPLRQLRPTFYTSDGFDAAVNGDIYGNEQARFPEYMH